MQLHNLKPKHESQKEHRIGRGGKRGTYSGRGIKGQKARAGAKIRPHERELLKKIPKLRGYKFKSFRQKPAIINLKDIERVFTGASVITPRALYEKGLMPKIKGRFPRVKVLSVGDTKKKFVFKNIMFSRAARKKVVR